MKKIFLLLIGLYFPFAGSSQSCLPLGITFSTQAQIDSFQINYPNCTQITGTVNIIGSTISNLNGLNVITSIGGALWIDNNNALTSFIGLNALTSIGNSIYILNNPALTSLTGINSLSFIWGTLGITGNPLLANLTALSSLTTSKLGFLSITSNDSLKSLTGLDNIDSDSIQYLYIYGNHSLTTCQVKSICAYLANPYGVIDISNNTTGCDSQQEVEAACAAISLKNITNDNAFTIYPNPATDKLTVVITRAAEEPNLNISNIEGQQLITRQITQPKTQLDINSLPSGVYFVRLTSDKSVLTGKFIKQ